MELTCICTIYDFFVTPINWKDYIIPFISPIIGVFGAVWIMNKQFKKQEQLEKDKIKKEDAALLHQINFLNPKLVNNLNEGIKYFEELKSEMNIDASRSFKMLQSNPSLFDSISIYGYKRIFWLLKNIDAANDEDILEYWQSISKAPKSYESLKVYVEDQMKVYNNINNDLNSRLSFIMVECSKLIHNVFKPHTTVTYTNNDLDKPEFKLAFELKRIFDAYRVEDGKTKLRKNKILLESLNSLKDDPVASQAFNSELAQKIADTLGKYSDFDSLFKSMENTLNGYKNAFEAIKKNIESIKISDKK